MRKKPWLSLAVVAGCSAGCTQIPKSICEMPSNAHVWQGSTVSWSGKLFDSWAQPHGGGAQFSDERCGRSIKVYTQRPFFTADAEYNHSAMADAHIEGTIMYADGRFWLRPESVKLLSPWITGKALDAYSAKGYERRKKTEASAILALQFRARTADPDRQDPTTLLPFESGLLDPDSGPKVLSPLVGR